MRVAIVYDWLIKDSFEQRLVRSFELPAHGSRIDSGWLD